MGFSGNEAYLIGVLLGRGSIEQVKNGYLLTFRFPYRRYNPAQVAIAECLLERGPLSSSQIAEMPPLRVMGISSMQISRYLQLIRDWHPPHRKAKGRVVRHDKKTKKWSIDNKEDLKGFLSEQGKFKEREISSTDFVIEHIQTITSDMGENVQIRKEPSSFMVSYLTLECRISNILFEKLKKEYGLDVGDVYRHIGIPGAIDSYNQDQLQEFMRGVSDATVHFDRAPIWEWMADYKDSRLWQLRFAAVCDNPRFTFDLCHIMQDRLGIPIFIINWAGLDKYRGKRDIFAEVWALNLESFPMPLFYNRWKQEHLETSLGEDREKLEKRGVKKEDLSQLGGCPRRPREMPDYMKRCKGFFNCPKIPQRLLSNF